MAHGTPTLEQVAEYPHWTMIGTRAFTRLDYWVVEVEHHGSILTGRYELWSCTVEEFQTEGRIPFRRVGEFPFDVAAPEVGTSQKIWDDLATHLPERMMEFYL